jgi:chemotaxis methyl-accepting protein methylase
MLRPGGALLLGSSESLCTISEEFKVEIVDNVCYNLKKTA